MSYSNSVSVTGSVDLSFRTIAELAEAIGRQVPVSPCFARELGPPLHHIDASISSTADTNAKLLSDLGVQLAKMLASPSACQSAEWYAWGWRAASNGRWGEATRELAKAVETNPYDAHAQLALAYSLLESGDREAAVAPLRGAIEEGLLGEEPVALRAAITLADVVAESEGEAGAVLLLEEVIERAPFSADLLAARARWSGSAEHAAELIRTAPNWAVAHAPDLVGDPDRLLRDPERTRELAAEAKRAAEALEVEWALFVPEQGLDRPSLLQAIEPLRATADRLGAEQPFAAGLAEARANLQSWQERRRAIVGTKVKRKERDSQAAATAEADAAINALEASIQEMSAAEADRNGVQLPALRRAADALAAAPLRSDQPSVGPIPAGMEGLPALLPV